MSRPEFLYKYRQDQPRHVEALINCKAIFSGRQGFNDPYDAKFSLVEPSIPELERIDLANRVAQCKDAFQLPRFVERGAMTKSGKAFLQSFYKLCDERIEAYRFYCLSADPISRLMWPHYAGDHSGFCIEFKAEHVGGDKVSYDDGPLEIRLHEHLMDVRSHALGRHIWTGLRTKQTAWKYEEEYRVQPANAMQRRLVKITEHSDEAEYDPSWVESVIFGCRMPDKRRREIIQSYKHRVKFKQVVMSGTGFAIIHFG